MAYEVGYWQPDGKGESQIRATRIKKVVEAAALAEPQNRPSGCVRVTLDRTDKQSPVTKDLWVKPGYVDPFK
jgi:hypothetical protein